MSKKKAGRLSNSERQFIVDNAGRMHPRDIAAKLGRSEDVVFKEIREAAPPPAPPDDSPETSQIRLDFKKSPAWKRLTQELETDELAYFEDQYVKLVAQFKDDVLATEENQLYKAVKYEIMMSRNATQQKRVNREIARLERTQEEFVTLKTFDQLDDRDRELLTGLEAQLQTTYASRQALTTEYVKMDEKHQRLLEDLKSLRRQRIDKIESGKVDYLGLVRMLCDEAVQADEEKQIELMRRATGGELKRLATPHVFADGVTDQPLLTADTVRMLDEGVVKPPETESDKRRKNARGVVPVSAPPETPAATHER
jgi:hypothetical protein